MAAFDFTGSDGTLLSTYDSRFQGPGATTLRLLGGALAATAAFGGGRFWFPNGQADTQSVEATLLLTGTTGGEAARVTLQTNGSQVGYEAELRPSDGDIDLTRNGAFINRLTGGGTPAGAVVMKMTYNSSTGLVTVFTGGTSRGTYTDGAPLTGGFPGGNIVSGSAAGIPQMLDWADLEAVVPAVLSAPGSASVGATTASMTYTSDKAGTAYAVATSTNSNPGAAAIKAGSGGTIVAAGSQVMAAGVNTLPLTGLSTTTVYYLWGIGTNGSDSNIVGPVSVTTTATAPNITGVNNSNPRPGQSVVVTGTAFGAAGAVQLGGVAQAVTARAPTSLTYTATQGTNKRGASLGLTITDSATGLTSAPFAGTTLAPEVGWAIVDIATPDPVATKRITTAPLDMAAGDQAHYDTVGGTVTVLDDGTFVVDTALTFDAELWSPGLGVGLRRTQTVT